MQNDNEILNEKKTKMNIQNQKLTKGFRRSYKLNLFGSVESQRIIEN